MHKILFLLFVITVHFVSAQNYSFGKVSKEELVEQYNPSDSSAVATYLYKYRRTYFNYVSGQGFNQVTDIHERIKIYNKDGYDYGTKKVSLYKDGSTNEKLSGLKAVTFNLENGKIEERKLKRDGEFEVELSQYYDQKSFTMPNLKEGSIIEYKYQVVSPFVSNVDEFVFQHDIPVKKLEAVMDAPEYFNFRVNVKGFLGVIPKIEKLNRKAKISERVTQKSGNGLGGGVTTKRETGTIDYVSKVSKYDLGNIPALREEPFVNGIDNYRSGVKYELSYIKYPNSPLDTYATDWPSVVKAIYESSSFGSELKKTGYFEDDIDPLISAISDDEQKILAIFTFVKSKVKWNGFYGKYTENGVKKAYKDRTGNVAEVNLMLTAMLRYAGLEANPVLVSTRKNGIPLFPTREGYNYVVSGVELPSGMVLLDATHTYSTPNVLPFRTLNWEGRIIRKDGTSATVNLYPTTKSNRKIFMSASLADDGGIDGKIRVSYAKHDAISFRESYFKTNEEDYLNNLEKENGDIEIDEFTVKNVEDINKSAVASYGWAMDSGMEMISNKVYFAPMFFLRSTENPFKLDKREFPIDFGYPSGQDYTFSINLPEGYQIETLPEPMAIALPDGMGVFKYNIVGKANMIQLKVKSEINSAIIPAHYYDVLKEYYKKVVEKMNERVVLSKA